MHAFTDIPSCVQCSIWHWNEHGYARDCAARASGAAGPPAVKPSDPQSAARGRTNNGSLLDEGQRSCELVSA